MGSVPRSGPRPGAGAGGGNSSSRGGGGSGGGATLESRALVLFARECSLLASLLQGHHLVLLELKLDQGLEGHMSVVPRARGRGLGVAKIAVAVAVAVAVAPGLDR